MEINAQPTGQDHRNEHEEQVVSSPIVHEVPRSLSPVREPIRQCTLIPSNLPPRLGPFIGRADELKAVNNALAGTSRIISIEGMGGIGKTSLALESALQLFTISENSRSNGMESQFDGFIWLSAKDRSLTIDQVADTIGRTLDYAFVSRIPFDQKLSAVKDLLRAARYLVIIDSFDSLDPQLDKDAIDFLTSLPEPTKLLITSRRRLDTDFDSIDLSRMNPSDAMEMIRVWAKNKRMKSVAGAGEDTLQSIYRATGGLPMAIKWALGQMKQKGQSLDVVLDYLGQARSDIFDHIFTYSWSILSANSTLILKTMTVFFESVDRNAISAVSGISGYDLDQGLGQLVEMSLIDPDDTSLLNKRRYGLHPLTKIYSSQYLKADPSFESTIKYRAANYYLDFVKSNSAWENVSGLDRLTEELPNVLGWMEWCWETNEHALLISFHRGMYNYFWTKGHWNSNLIYGRRALDAAALIGDLESQAWILIESLGWINFCQGNFDAAYDCYIKGQEIFTGSSNQQGLSRAFNYLGRLYAAKGMLSEAKSTLECGLKLAPDPMSLSFCESALGDVAREQNNLEEAKIHYLKVKEIREIMKDDARLASVLCDLGEIAIKLDEVDSAKTYFRECLDIATRIGRLDVHARCLRGFAQVENRLGHMDRAIASAKEAAEEFQRLGAKRELDSTNKLILSITITLKPDNQHAREKGRQNKIKILFLAANPSDTARLRLDEEFHSIDRALRAAEFRDRFELESHWAVRVEDVQGLLLRHKPDIVHFSGHGSAQNGIILQGRSGASFSIPISVLGQLFSALKENIRCVVLNACFTEEQAHIIIRQIDYVIGTSVEISDTAAICFSKAFYQALGYGKDIQTAFELGCLELDLEGMSVNEKPKLLSR